MSNAPKSFAEFSMRDWKNFGIYLVLLGLIIAFLGKELVIGGLFIVIGFILTVYLKFIRKTNLY